MTLKTVAVLSCLHSVVYSTSPPKHNDLVYCVKCDAYRRVGLAPSTWAVSCVNCSRWRYREYGQGFVTAETRAVTHASRAPGHRVTLLKDGVVFSEYYHAPTEIEVDGTVPF